MAEVLRSRTAEFGRERKCRPSYLERVVPRQTVAFCPIDATLPAVPPVARCETDVINGAETCVRVGACTRSQRGRRDSLCPIGAGWRRLARLLFGHGWSRPSTGAAGCRSSCRPGVWNRAQLTLANRAKQQRSRHVRVGADRLKLATSPGVLTGLLLVFHPRICTRRARPRGSQAWTRTTRCGRQDRHSDAVRFAAAPEPPSGSPASG